MDTELKIKQLQQAYNTLESHIKNKQSFYLDDPHCFKMKQEQIVILRQIVELEANAD
jgi:hypothetical protein